MRKGKNKKDMNFIKSQRNEISQSFEFEQFSRKCAVKSHDGKNCPNIGVNKVEDSLKNDGTFNYLCDRCYNNYIKLNPPTLQ